MDSNIPRSGGGGKGKKRPAGLPVGEGPQAQCIDYPPSSPVRGPRQEKNPAPRTDVSTPRTDGSTDASKAAEEGRATRARPLTLIYEHYASAPLRDAVETLRPRIEKHDARRRFNARRAKILDTQGEYVRARALAACGGAVKFRISEDGEGVLSASISGGLFCQQPRLCRICAARRTGRLTEAYWGRLLQCALDDEALVPVMANVTQRTGPRIDERLSSLSLGLTRLFEGRRRALSAPGRRNHSELSKAAGGVFSIEIKRGAGGAGWHVHAHGLLLLRQWLDADAFTREWARCIGQQYASTYLKQLDDPIDFVRDIQEVFKYNVKLGEIADCDALNVFRAVHGKKLLRPFGVVKGVQLQEDNRAAPREGPEWAVFADDEHDAYQVEYWGPPDLL